MRFMMLMIPKGYETAEPGVKLDPERVAAMMKYNESLQKAGVLLALDGLHPPSMGARVTFDGEKPKVTDGPFAEAKEVLGGYWMIQVKSREEAIEWASRCPASANEIIEIRQVQEMSDFPDDVKEAAGRVARDSGAGRATERLVTASDPRRAIEAVWRIESAKLIAGIARMVRDVGLAEELAQDALVAALEQWPESGRAGQSGRLAHGRGEAPRDRPDAPQAADRAQARGARPRARDRAGHASRTSTPRSTTISATICCASCSPPAIRCCPPRRGWRSRCACSAA